MFLLGEALFLWSFVSHSLIGYKIGSAIMAKGHKNKINRAQGEIKPARTRLAVDNA